MEDRPQPNRQGGGQLDVEVEVLDGLPLYLFLFFDIHEAHRCLGSDGVVLVAAMCDTGQGFGDLDQQWALAAVGSVSCLWGAYGRHFLRGFPSRRVTVWGWLDVVPVHWMRMRK